MKLVESVVFLTMFLMEFQNLLQLTIDSHKKAVVFSIEKRNVKEQGKKEDKVVQEYTYNCIRLK